MGDRGMGYVGFFGGMGDIVWGLWGRGVWVSSGRVLREVERWGIRVCER